ncbi:MAG TPA: hypothetical protein VMY37_33335 [Thermoguttaceae bacterium]|nr:hypothetical protein [Thermoguttaceae bacterium]
MTATEHSARWQAESAIIATTRLHHPTQPATRSSRFRSLAFGNHSVAPRG